MSSLLIPTFTILLSFKFFFFFIVFLKLTVLFVFNECRGVSMRLAWSFFFFFWVRKNTASLGLEVYPILYFCLKGKKERKRNARIISWALHNKDCNPKGSWSESHSKWCLRSVGFRCSGVLELPPDQHHYLHLDVTSLQCGF